MNCGPSRCPGGKISLRPSRCFRPEGPSNVNRLPRAHAVWEQRAAGPGRGGGPGGGGARSRCAQRRSLGCALEGPRSHWPRRWLGRASRRPPATQREGRSTGPAGQSTCSEPPSHAPPPLPAAVSSGGPEAPPPGPGCHTKGVF